MLHVENVSKIYRTRNGPRKVLDDISFDLAKGRNIGILGRNGAGKSTLIRLLAGAEQPTRGTIDRGMSVSWPLAFGGAFQQNLTGLDNLKFVCRTYGVDYKSKLAFVEDFTELGEYFREPVMHYSMGMTTRLAFALSMAIEFDCFLIDEAMVVGDARFHERCHVIKMYCERASVLHEGKLIPFENVDDAYDFYQTHVVAVPSSQVQEAAA
jgi:capsular polysaccharide transport system ATP-binding protein